MRTVIVRGKRWSCGGVGLGVSGLAHIPGWAWTREWSGVAILRVLPETPWFAGQSNTIFEPIGVEKQTSQDQMLWARPRIPESPSPQCGGWVESGDEHRERHHVIGSKAGALTVLDRARLHDSAGTPPIGQAQGRGMLDRNSTLPRCPRSITWHGDRPFVSPST